MRYACGPLAPYGLSVWSTMCISAYLHICIISARAVGEGREKENKGKGNKEEQIRTALQLGRDARLDKAKRT